MGRAARTTVLFAISSLLSGYPAMSEAQDGNQRRDDWLRKPRVSAGLFVIRPDGTPGGSATEDGAEAGAAIAATVYTGPCGLFGGARPGFPVSASATEAWRLSGRVIAISDREASFLLTWQRALADGRAETASPKSVTLTLARGQRLRLESLTVPAAGACAAHVA